MHIFLTILAGIIVTSMNIFNGQLSHVYGIFLSTVIVHLIGLVTFLIICIYKKKTISIHRALPLYLYIGGIIGVLTVIFNAISISTIGATLMTTLSLTGQMITSIILENNGWLGSIKRNINIYKLISCLIVIIGVGVMLL